jgi:hypothetical protein
MILSPGGQRSKFEALVGIVILTMQSQTDKVVKW